MVLSEINNYIEDDWDDNALTNRSSTDEGYFLHPSDNLLSGDYEAGDALKGVYRPEWNEIENGSSTVSVSNNRLILSSDSNGNSPFASTTSAFNSGSWRFTAAITSASDSTSGRSGFNAGSAAKFESDRNTFQYIFDTNQNEVTLNDTTSGSATTAIGPSSATIGTEFNDYEVTVDSYLNAEIFFNGTSKGTGTISSGKQYIYIFYVTIDRNQTAEIDTMVIQ